jgi:predicted nucleotidyltransferase
MEAQAATVKIDPPKLLQAMRARGFDSVTELADSLGLHRNTVGNYLSGKTGMPQALALILEALDLAPGEVLYLDRPSRQVPGLCLSDLLERWQKAQPEAAWALFGSRARGTAKLYSDYDVGVYQDPGLSYTAYSRLLDLAAQWNESQLTTVQLVDLGRADESFLHRIGPDLVLLGGSTAAWCALLRKAGLHLHE